MARTNPKSSRKQTNNICRRIFLSQIRPPQSLSVVRPSAILFPRVSFKLRTKEHTKHTEYYHNATSTESQGEGEGSKENMGEEVKLYGLRLSPFVVRAEWALQLKGVEYEYVDEDLKNKSPQLLQYNPVYKAVPVLVHGGRPVCESTVIVEYVDEVWKEGHALLPADPYGRARARFWTKFAEDKCLHGSFAVFSGVGHDLKKAVKDLQDNLKTLEGYLEGKKFFGGNKIGMVDIVAGWIAIWLPIMEDLVSETIVDDHLPLIKAWIADFLEQDLVKQTMPPLDKVMTHMRALRESAVAAKTA